MKKPTDDQIEDFVIWFGVICLLLTMTGCTVGVLSWGFGG